MIYFFRLFLVFYIFAQHFLASYLWKALCKLALQTYICFCLYPATSYPVLGIDSCYWFAFFIYFHAHLHWFFQLNKLNWVIYTSLIYKAMWGVFSKHRTKGYLHRTLLLLSKVKKSVDLEMMNHLHVSKSLHVSFWSIAPCFKACAV